MRLGKRHIGATIALILAIPVAATVTAYAITTWSAGSICLSEGGWSDAADKVSGVRRYIEQHPLPDNDRQSAIRAGFDHPSCCSIDKGGIETPDLTLSAFILHGKTHYVHVPANAVPDKEEHLATSSVTVDGCGNGVSQGIDL